MRSQLLLIMCGAALLASCGQRPAPRSLKDQDSSFRLRPDAPESRLSLAQAADGVSNGGPVSTFGEPAAPASTFREVEVAPEKLAQTSALISELHARKTADQSIAVDLPSDVLFDFDKAVLRADANSSLKKAADLIASYPQAPLIVNGHTDSKGSDAYNVPLSERRAQAVATWLKAHTGRPVATAGFGKHEPLVSNTRPDGSDDPAGRQRNRRVEILIRQLME